MESNGNGNGKKLNTVVTIASVIIGGAIVWGGIKYAVANNTSRIEKSEVKINAMESKVIGHEKDIAYIREDLQELKIGQKEILKALK